MCKKPTLSKTYDRDGHKSHHKSQRWPGCMGCMPQIWTNFLSVGPVLIECWPCAPLSCVFNFFLPQETQQRCLDGPNPVWNSNDDQPDSAVCPKMECFIECWSHALMSVAVRTLGLQKQSEFVAVFRDLGGNKISGTMPEAISFLVKLTTLCALTSFVFSVGSTVSAF